MQKKLITCLGAVVITIGTATTSLAITSGCWDLNSGLDNGFWQEAFAGGGPGQPGNVLTGGDLGPTPVDQYLLGFGLTLASVTPGAGVNEYWTTYTGGQLNLLDGGPWGDGASFYGLTALNHSITGPNGQLWFDLVITGPNVTVNAVFDSTTADSYGPTMKNGVVTGHKGSGFEKLSVCVPDGGSTLALLGSGLLGLIAIGRNRILGR